MAGRTEHFYDGYFHGTPHKDWAENIARNGFHLEHSGHNGSDSGDGVYASNSKGFAAEYAFESGSRGAIIPVALQPDKPYIHKEGGWEAQDPKIMKTAGRLDQEDFHDRRKHVESRGGDSSKVKAYGAPSHFPAALQEHGHDAWMQGGLAVVYNPKKVVVAGKPITKREYMGW